MPLCRATRAAAFVNGETSEREIEFEMVKFDDINERGTRKDGIAIIVVFVADNNESNRCYVGE